jgi:hypothetical protein
MRLGSFLGCHHPQNRLSSRLRGLQRHRGPELAPYGLSAAALTLEGHSWSSRNSNRTPAAVNGSTATVLSCPWPAFRVQPEAVCLLFRSSGHVAGVRPQPVSPPPAFSLRRRRAPHCADRPVGKPTCRSARRNVVSPARPRQARRDHTRERASGPATAPASLLPAARSRVRHTEPARTSKHRPKPEPASVRGWVRTARRSKLQREGRRLGGRLTTVRRTSAQCCHRSDPRNRVGRSLPCCHGRADHRTSDTGCPRIRLPRRGTSPPDGGRLCRWPGIAMPSDETGLGPSCPGIPEGTPGRRPALPPARLARAESASHEHAPAPLLGQPPHRSAAAQPAYGSGGNSPSPLHGPVRSWQDGTSAPARRSETA